MPIVKSGRSTAGYYIGYPAEDSAQPSSNWINLNNYLQQEGHTCGFIAAMTVAHYFYPTLPAVEVLRAVRPSIDWGVNRHKLIEGLQKLGIEAEYRYDLTVDDLRAYVSADIPVIISVWPEDWYSDHWTVVWGFDDSEIYLTNHYSPISLDDFFEEWSDFDMRNGHGASAEGIVCLGRAAP